MSSRTRRDIVSYAQVPGTLDRIGGGTGARGAGMAPLDIAAAEARRAGAGDEFNGLRVRRAAAARGRAAAAVQPRGELAPAMRAATAAGAAATPASGIVAETALGVRHGCVRAGVRAEWAVVAPWRRAYKLRVCLLPLGGRGCKLIQ